MTSVMRCHVRLFFRVRIHRRARKSCSLWLKLMTAAHDKTFAAVPASAEHPDYVAGRA
jgi:hypothetical protein